MKNTSLEEAFQLLAIGDEGRACRDIPDTACREEPRNFFTHVAALTASKTADGLIDPKLVLSWLLTALGAPAAVVGLLVPVREAGALLPQLFTAAALRRLPLRKWAWAAGAAFQGGAALAIVAAALTLDGAAAGWAILAALTVLALARSVCSVSYKDVLGKTVSKARRGAATGLAGSLAAGAVILFALILSSGLAPRMVVVTVALLAAGAFWIAAAALFSTLAEEPGATEGGGDLFALARQNIGMLASDVQLRRFITTRALLTATALAPPFMVAAGGAASGGDYGALGLLVLASAGASLTSSYVWGRLADRSSRMVLALSAAIGTAALASVCLTSMAGWLSQPAVLPIILFVLMLAYQGVRLGRSTHLVDMANEETRAAYTALSNTTIGVLLLAGGLFSVLSQFAGPIVVLGVMAAMCLAAVPAALSLDEVQAQE